MRDYNRVPKRILLEISVESAERARAAESGGADRLELCCELALGGLTPPRALIEAVRKSVRIPVLAMIRPRAGDFVYSETEFAEMLEAIAWAREARIEGVVAGLLGRDRRVDRTRTAQLVGAARGLEVTFHRAVDDARDLLEAVDEIAEAGVTRILTSGGKPTALDGAPTIAAMIERARGRVDILPGAGINAGNLGEIVRRTGAEEVHAGLSSLVPRSAAAGRFEEEVRRLSTAATRFSQ